MKIPATKYPVERRTLDNGLRVVLTPDRSAPVVGVAVVYDVGIRSEPEGRTGFAHLFEHLMFQGSENLEKLAHFRHVQGAGGSFNGGLRAYYFALAALTWFIGPYPFMAATLWVVMILIRRQFVSRTFRAMHRHAEKLQERQKS